MLDALPGIRMSGEKLNELHAIRRMIDNVKHPQASKPILGPPKMIESINPPVTAVDGTVEEDDSNTIVGFKTIRLLQHVKEGDEAKELVKFITEMIPCARIGINIRSEVEKQAKSLKLTLFSSESPAMDVDGLQKMNDRLRSGHT